MSDDPPILVSLRAAVAAAPGDAALRLHLCELLLQFGLVDEAVQQLAVILEQDPSSAAARALMARAVYESRDPVELPASGADFDWRQAEQEMGDRVPPMFVEGGPGEEVAAFDVEPSQVRLDDVGGMEEVKKRLNAAFLAPMRNPELRKLYGKSLNGGLLLYGPPGCGKTFLARAVAGEMGARFLSVSVADVIDMYIGQSERNIRELFAIARQHAPCVIFLDEVDALGQKRSQLRASAMRSSVNQLLSEMDGVSANNDGVFVLGATNHPWDVDSALRRPGRFDRTLLVLPPDAKAREAIFRYHLQSRPIASVDLAKLAKLTEDFSGADIAHVCESAVENALLASVDAGEPRLISMDELESAARDVRPSTGPWFDIARNVALFANEGGVYDDLLTYLKAKKLV